MIVLVRDCSHAAIAAATSRVDQLTYKVQLRLQLRLILGGAPLAFEQVTELPIAAAIFRQVRRAHHRLAVDEIDALHFKLCDQVIPTKGQLVPDE